MKNSSIPLSKRLHYSLRLGGWSKIILPTFLGQFIGYLAATEFTWLWALYGALLGLLTLFVIIFLNDLADEKVDRIKRSLHPTSSSPKTLPDNLISKKLVIFLGVSSSLLLVSLGFAIEVLYEKPYFASFTFLIFFMNYSYSFAPLKLNYLFGGELIEACGVGVFLPYCNAYLQSSLLWHSHYLTLLPFFFWALSQALCSGVCDITSDQLGGKKTFSVLFGNKKTIQLIFLSLLFFTSSFIVLNFSLQLNLLPFGIVFTLFLLSLTKKFSYYTLKEKIENSISLQKKFRTFLHKISKFLFYSFIICICYLSRQSF